MQYHITWIPEPTGEGRATKPIPSNPSGVMAVEASNPREAFRKFVSMYPNYVDGEGDKYVNVEDEFGEPLLEAGVVTSTGQTFINKHPDAQ